MVVDCCCFHYENYSPFIDVSNSKKNIQKYQKNTFTVHTCSMLYLSESGESLAEMTLAKMT